MRDMLTHIVCTEIDQKQITWWQRPPIALQAVDIYILMLRIFVSGLVVDDAMDQSGFR